KKEYLSKIKEKIYKFENSDVDDSNYLKFLNSNESLLSSKSPITDNFLTDISGEGLLKSSKYNRLVFGAPGTGKSHLLDEDTKRFFMPWNIKRITFHKSMSNGQIVGTYKPRPNKQNKNLIMYEFVPGVFTKQLIKALQNPLEDYLVIIEELNRADAQAVFGDV